jgi:hypothetical protein
LAALGAQLGGVCALTLSVRVGSVLQQRANHLRVAAACRLVKHGAVKLGGPSGIYITTFSQVLEHGSEIARLDRLANLVGKRRVALHPRLHSGGLCNLVLGPFAVLRSGSTGHRLREFWLNAPIAQVLSSVVAQLALYLEYFVRICRGVPSLRLLRRHAVAALISRPGLMERRRVYNYV